MTASKITLKLYKRPHRTLEGMFAKGYVHFDKGEHEDALHCLKEHIKKNPRDIEAHYLMSLTLVELDLLPEAARCADMPWDTKNEIPRLLLEYVKQHHGYNEYDLALMIVATAEESGAPPSKVRYVLGVIGFDVSNEPEYKYAINDAAYHIVEACRLDDDNSSYHSMASNILLTKYYRDETKDDSILRESIKHGCRAVMLGDDDYMTYFNLGQAHERLNDIETAISYFEQALARNPKGARAHGMLGVCMTWQKAKPQNYYQKAIEHLDRAAQLDPTIDVSLDKANALREFGDVMGAIKILDQLIKRSPERAFVWELLGRTYLDADDIVNANACMVTANQLDPTIPTLADLGVVSELMAIASMRYTENRFDAALQCINKHIQNDPDDTSALYFKAHVLEDMGRWQDAIDWLDRIWDPKSVNSERMLMRARLYAKAGDAQKAFMFIDSAQEFGISRAEICYSKGAIMDYLAGDKDYKMMDDAIDCMLEACQLDDTDSRYHSGASQMLMSKCGRDGSVDDATLKKSIKHGQRAVELGDNNRSTYYHLGHAFMQLGHDEKAIKYFAQALATDPDFLEAKVMLGSVMVDQEGKPPEYYKLAIRYLDDALHVDPSDELARDSRKIAQQMLDVSKQGVQNGSGVAAYDSDNN